MGSSPATRQFTYREFGERCERLASALPKYGIEPGDRVAYLSFNTHQLLEGYYGVVLAHAIVMPLNVRLSPGWNLQNILNHSGARMLLFENDFAPLVEQLKPACPGIERLVAWMKSGSPLPISPMKNCSIKASPSAPTFSASMKTPSPSCSTPAAARALPRASRCRTARSICMRLAVASVYREPETMVDLHTIPLFHANGWGRPQASTMLGTKQIMVRRFDPRCGVSG